MALAAVSIGKLLTDPNAVIHAIVGMAVAFAAECVWMGRNAEAGAMSDPDRSEDDRT